MKNHTPLLSFAFILLLNSSAAVAQCSAIGWSSDPAVNLNVSPWGANPRACTDSKGGVYISFNLNTTPFTSQWIQWVDRCGNIRWPQPVEILGEQDGTEYHPSLAADGFGGAIIAYTEWRVTNQFPFVDRGRIRVNRIDSSGTLLWGATGVRASLKDTAQYFPQVVPDGLGGAFVSTPTEDDSLFVQHISPSGQRLWSDKGIFIGDINLSYTYELILDEQDGFIVEWLPTTNPFVAHFRRVGYSGNFLWQDTTPVNQYYFKLAPDGNGGLVMGGIEHITGGKRNIIANRISHVGVFVWGQSGITVDDSLSSFSGISSVTFGSDSVLTLYWTDAPHPVNNFNVYTQMISSNGNFLFPDKIPVSGVNSLKGSVEAILSDSNANIFTWVDSRTTNTPLYAQKLDRSGNALWDTLDVEITGREYRNQVAIANLNGGIIVVWDEAPLRGIYAQQVNKDGVLGDILNGLSIGNSIQPLTSKEAVLYPNYPNPFNSSSIIIFRLPRTLYVRLVVYNLLGQRIRTLLEKKLIPGAYSITWDGTDNYGQEVSSGIYIYQLKAERQIISKKLLFIK